MKHQLLEDKNEIKNFQVARLVMKETKTFHMIWDFFLKVVRKTFNFVNSSSKVLPFSSTHEKKSTTEQPTQTDINLPLLRQEQGLKWS